MIINYNPAHRLVDNRGFGNVCLCAVSYLPSRRCLLAGGAIAACTEWVTCVSCFK